MSRRSVDLDDVYARNVDLGSGVYYRTFVWAPDRDLNPQYANSADMDPAGVILGHLHDDGSRCEGGVTFEGVPGPGPRWQVQSVDPLTISPSVLMTPEKGGCGLHGFIRDGRWVDAGSPKSYPNPPGWMAPE